jgi:signal transduction histidine kinase
MGHTLRSPLNAILGFADVLLYGSSGPLTDRQRRHVQQLVDAGERQLEIIDNLVELSRIHSGDSTAQPEATDPLRILETAVGTFGPKAEAKGVSILLDAEPDLGAVHVDPEGLTRAVGNLLSNAIRHLDEGGVIRIAVSRESPSGGTGSPAGETLQICVADSGPGIGKEEQKFLFQDLDHGDAFTARQKQRNGTGLPLARRLVERHGGQIWVESSGRRGDGSRFMITLPLIGGDDPPTKLPADKTGAFGNGGRP